MKNIALLGSTGSIGKNVLRVARARPGEFRITALAAGGYSRILREQIREFRPRFVSVASPDEGAPSSAEAKAMGFRFLSGNEGLAAIAAMPSSDIVFNAVVGAVGVYPLAAALAAGKTVALANKESVVIAGDYIRKRVKTKIPSRRAADARREGRFAASVSGGLAIGEYPRIIPVDSEHSAIFQCLEGRRSEDVRSIIITASGGSLYGRNKTRVSVAEVLKHPTWKMGKKITVDSATLMNKGLEVIEAHHLFGLPYDKISTVIHPQSIVHSMVEFVDGSVLAQMSPADMRYAIQYALTYPARRASGLSRLSLGNVGRLDFKKPDFSDFPCFDLAISAGRAGGIMPAVMNAANEVAVGAFLAGRAAFGDIPGIIAKTMGAYSNRSKNPSLDEIIEADKSARGRASECIRR